MAKKTVPKAISQYMAEIGARGGKKGRGQRKKRPAAHYKKLVEQRMKTDSKPD